MRYGCHGMRTKFTYAPISYIAENRLNNLIQKFRTNVVLYDRHNNVIIHYLQQKLENQQRKGRLIITSTIYLIML